MILIMPALFTPVLFKRWPTEINETNAPILDGFSRPNQRFDPPCIVNFALPLFPPSLRGAKRRSKPRLGKFKGGLLRR
jgi:hypothetical protein